MLGCADTMGQRQSSGAVTLHIGRLLLSPFALKGFIPNLRFQPSDLVPALWTELFSEAETGAANDASPSVESLSHQLA